MEDILRKVVPPILLFLTMGLPFLIVVNKFDQLHIGRIKFAVGTIVSVAIGLLNLPGFFVWIPIVVYAVLCGLRANELALKDMTKFIDALTPGLLFFAWPYFALAKKDDNFSKLQQIRLAAEQGDASAQNDLCDIYLEGKIVRKDLKAALYWLEKAASAGLRIAQTNLGWAYMSDYLELAPDYQLAMEWSLKAANQGPGESAENIALLYENGWGVPVNQSEAANWRKKGDVEAIETSKIQENCIENIDSTPLVTETTASLQATSNETVSQKLRELQNLRKEEIITEDEFQQKKQQLLEKF